MNVYIELDAIAELAWTGSIARLATFHALGIVIFIGRHILLTRTGVTSKSNVLWVVSSGVMISTFLLLIWTLPGGFGGPGCRIYHSGVVACLLVAVSAFVGFLRLDKLVA